MVASFFLLGFVQQAEGKVTDYLHPDKMFFKT